MLPSSHPPLMASQRKLERKCVASQIPARKSGENSRRKLQNVVTDSTAQNVTLVRRDELAAAIFGGRIATSAASAHRATGGVSDRRINRLSAKLRRWTSPPHFTNRSSCVGTSARKGSMLDCVAITRSVGRDAASDSGRLVMCHERKPWSGLKPHHFSQSE